MHGSAYANYTMQEADLVICLGARFDDRVTGNVEKFAARAKPVHTENGVTGGIIQFEATFNFQLSSPTSTSILCLISFALTPSCISLASFPALSSPTARRCNVEQAVHTPIDTMRRIVLYWGRGPTRLLTLSPPFFSWGTVSLQSGLCAAARFGRQVSHKNVNKVVMVDHVVPGDLHGYGTFRLNFHRFHRFELDLRGHTQP